MYLHYYLRLCTTAARPGESAWPPVQGHHHGYLTPEVEEQGEVAVLHCALPATHEMKSLCKLNQNIFVLVKHFSDSYE